MQKAIFRPAKVPFPCGAHGWHTVRAGRSGDFREITGHAEYLLTRGYSLLSVLSGWLKAFLRKN